MKPRRLVVLVKRLIEERTNFEKLVLKKMEGKKEFHFKASAKIEPYECDLKAVRDENSYSYSIYMLHPKHGWIYVHSLQ